MTDEHFRALKEAIDEKYFQKGLKCSCGTSFPNQKDYTEGTRPHQRGVSHYDEMGLLIARNHLCEPSRANTITFYLPSEDLADPRLAVLVGAIKERATTRGVREGASAESIVQDYFEWIQKQSS